MNRTQLIKSLQQAIRLRFLGIIDLATFSTLCISYETQYLTAISRNSTM